MLLLMIFLNKMVAYCWCYLPVNLFFLEDQVNQEDQQDPKTDTDGQKSERRECWRDSEERAKKKREIDYVNGKQ